MRPPGGFSSFPSFLCTGNLKSSDRRSPRALQPPAIALSCALARSQRSNRNATISAPGAQTGMPPWGAGRASRHYRPFLIGLSVGAHFVTSGGYETCGLPHGPPTGWQISDDTRSADATHAPPEARAAGPADSESPNVLVLPTGRCPVSGWAWWRPHLRAVCAQELFQAQSRGSHSATPA